MNNNIIIAFLVNFLLVNSMFSQQNSGRIVYNGVPNKSLIATGNKKQSKIKTIDSLISGMAPIEFELYFNNNESTYSQVRKIEDDKNFKIKLATILLGGNQVHYTNLKTKESFYQVDAYGELFIVHNRKKKWVLKKESKKIGKYNCFKATTYYTVNNSKGTFTYPVIAWYTTEIPIPFGPKEYYGLPGLILELQERNLNYKAIEIVINTDDGFKVKKPKRGKNLSKEEFENIGIDMGNNKITIGKN
ncbi:GLPGLI family protein [Lacinutrix sp. WUR7]|uniref:GLPGLI family protein n=1 Tax=Lacinutrix sp. WUR7 TaxID=2653681 RepID=UPI00193CCC70|nr:GLPGLI family protein [Lacinutrix sp. WUR7]QRM88784.1 GLPGLI family protein [Lacinutrix sp. WUR7]